MGYLKMWEVWEEKKTNNDHDRCYIMGCTIDDWHKKASGGAQSIDRSIGSSDNMVTW